MERYRITKVWVDDAHVWAETANGWKANCPFTKWRNLARATQEQRKKFLLSHYGIHWLGLDEDLCFEGMFVDAGLCKLSDGEDAVCYQA